MNGNEERKAAEAASALMENAEEATGAAPAPAQEKKADHAARPHAIRKYSVRDIVFLAVITACTLVTGAVMPLLVNVPLFGIVQLGLGLQFSVFPVIGLMKVRKPGALLLQAVFISVFLIFMFPPMALITVCALIAEALVLLLFHGYGNDWACVFAGTVYLPMTLPLMFLYYRVFYQVTGNEKAATSIFLGSTDPWVVIGISAAVVALCFAGSCVGMLVSREMKKAGVLRS